MERLLTGCKFLWKEKHFFFIFSYEENYFAELYIAVLYFTLEVIRLVVLCKSTCTK